MLLELLEQAVEAERPRDQRLKPLPKSWPHEPLKRVPNSGARPP
jgi:hypothetical protein